MDKNPEALGYFSPSALEAQQQLLGGWLCPGSSLSSRGVAVPLPSIPARRKNFTSAGLGAAGGEKSPKPTQRCGW